MMMVVGLCNAQEIFETLVSSVYDDTIDKFMVVYVDDILVLSPDETAHLNDLKINFRPVEREPELRFSREVLFNA